MTDRPPPFLTPIGGPVTYCGKVVTWDQWHRLSEWDRFGPDGRVWSGLLNGWVTPREYGDAVLAMRAEATGKRLREGQG